MGKTGTTRRRPGALGPHVEGFERHLLALGYTPGTARNQLQVLGHLGRWMEARELLAAELSVARIDQFLSETPLDGRWRGSARCALLRLLDHLAEENVVVMPARVAPSALEVLLRGFRDWMVLERGLADATVLRYEKTARRFLSQRQGTADGDPAADLTSAEVHAFLLAECARCSVGAAKGRVAELRSLLRYLYLRGLTSTPLAAAVPPVAGWQHTSIPATVSAPTVQALLDSCDRSTAVGIRDFAIITIVARLGLRSIEVARLELDDVHWRTGEITVRGKARRHDVMPLPEAVGAALAAYLLKARPRVGVEQRRLFMTCRAPRVPIRADLVGDVVEQACQRADLPRFGPHRLRHTLARQLLGSGVVLTDISQVLRHQDLATTAIYAKVDLDALRRVARPWPTVGGHQAGGRP